MPAPQPRRLVQHLRQLAADAGPDTTDRELIERFAARQDEDAFAALVRRHGSMVFRVGRRVLSSEHDAEDVFQATFLVLARKAAGLPCRRSLARWLYEVAYRLARESRRAEARRRARESRAGGRTDAPPEEVLAVLDEELMALPERLRLPLLLCYLEGNTRDEAARQLGWSPGTLKRRLAQGRLRLRERLSRRGFPGYACVLGVLLVHRQTVAVPAGLAARTLAGVLLGAGGDGTGLVTPGAARLAGRLARSATVTRVKVATALLLVLGTLAAGVGLASRETPRRATRPTPQGQGQDDPLPAGALARLGTVRFRPGHTPKALAFAPDGTFVVSASWYSTFCTWDPVTGKELRRWRVSDGATKSMDVSPDGKLLAAADSVAVHLVDSTGKVRFRLGSGTLKHTGRCVAFAPDGKTLAAAGEDRAVRLWEVSTGKELRQFQGHGSWVEGLSFAPDGRTLATAGDGGGVYLWEVASGRRLRRWFSDNERFKAIRFSPDGKLLATAGRSGRVQLWDAATGGKVLQLAGHGEEAHFVAFTPDGKSLVTGGRDGQVRIWETLTGKQRGFLAVSRPGALPALALARNGRTLAAGDEDCVVRLWDLATGKQAAQPEGHAGPVTAVVFAPDSKTLATSGGGTTRLWEPRTGKELRRFPETLPVAALAFSPDGRSLTALDARHQVSSRTFPAGRETARLGVGGQYSALSPDGRVLVTDAGRALALWDTVTGKQLRRLTPSRQTEKGSWVRLVFSRDSKRLAAVWDLGPDRVYLWDLEGKELGRFGPPEDPFPVPLRTVAFSPDNKLLATLDELARVRVWDAGTGRQLRAFEAPREGWSLLAVSPDGRSLPLGGVASSILLMDLATGQVSRRLQGHRGAIRDLSFSPDGRLLASASQDTTVLVWDLSRKK